MITSPFDKRFSFIAISSADIGDFRLHSEEEAMLSGHASERRRNSFTLGRAAARQALYSAGFSNPPPICRGPRGEPRWPDGIVGSISHCKNWAVCVVAPVTVARGIGLDLEVMNNSRPPELHQRICTKKELQWIEHGRSEGPRRFLQLFSAKESLYKALSPLTGKFLGFHDAEITFSPAQPNFSAELVADAGREFLAGSRFSGGYRVFGEYILSHVVVL